MSFVPQVQNPPMSDSQTQSYPNTQANFFSQLKTAENLCGKDDILANKIIEDSLIDLFLEEE